MQIKIFNRGHLLIQFTTPEIIFIRRDKDNDEIEFGPYLTKIDTGIYFSKYDYGNMLKIKVLGFGIDIWWMI